MLKIRPLSGGTSGKVKITVRADDGYAVNGTANKIKVSIVD